MDTVGVGSAVQYTEGDPSSAEWVVIEDTDDPSGEFDEISASTDRAKAILGKRVGDSFVIAKSSIKDRVGTVQQIISKYARRYQVLGEQMQKKFGDQSVIQMMRIPPAESVTLEELQPMLDRVKAQSEAVLQLRELYKSSPVTLRLYGVSFGDGAYEGLFDLAISESDFVKCAAPTRGVSRSC
jgi:hypothetical protein